MKTEAAYKLYSGVFRIFVPNIIKTDLYNFDLYRFKVGAFFETQCQCAWCLVNVNRSKDKQEVSCVYCTCRTCPHSADKTDWFTSVEGAQTVTTGRCGL